MRKVLLLAILLAFTVPAIAQKQVLPPDVQFGQLFKDVQLARIFPDNKTFVDCIPKRSAADIVSDYNSMKNNPAIRYSLKMFVEENFILPPEPPAAAEHQQEKDIVVHIRNLWRLLKRGVVTANGMAAPAGHTGSLLPLPCPYVVPGGRFREIYYWDSYFTMLGLQVSGEIATIENMVQNFAHLINRYGHIPNGNRSYYLSRSQPPFFSLMVDLLAEIKGQRIYRTYLPALKKEYAYWTDQTAATKHTVVMPDGSLLSRYYDQLSVPRQESYYEDYELSSKLSTAAAAALNRNLRSGAESGWDFSSRWFADSNNLISIQVTDIIPVDLNSLLYHLENTLSRACEIAGDKKGQAAYRLKAEQRRMAIEKYCWNNKAGYYFDFNHKTGKQSAALTAAGVFPLCFMRLSPEQLTIKGLQAATVLRQYLLKDGGIVSTTVESGQQWDAPNGWAPLQWMTVWALQRTGQKELAAEIVHRWTTLNEKVYASTGKMMEKYNVINTALKAGGGEYPSQDGFGWTNGVYLAMKKMQEKK